MKAGRVLLIEDDVDHALLIERALSGAAGVAEIRHAVTASQGMTVFEGGAIDIVLLDLTLPDLDGMEVLRRIRKHDPDVPVILVTAADSAPRGVEAMKAGATDYLVKDSHYLEALPALVARTTRQVVHGSCRAGSDHGAGRRHLDRRSLGATSLADLIGLSRPMQAVRALIRKAIEVPVNVLIEGETGVGKEVVARVIHFQGPRRYRLFAPVNCAAIPESLLESEFFGHVRGAFTGAHRDHAGLFEAAHGGTIFLDEIEDLCPMLQGKLLRVLQDREFKPVGSNRYRTCDVRIIAATNRDLDRLVSEGRFRQDLYYRLRVLPIRIPPLRERREDIPLLVSHFVSHFNRRHGTRFVPPRASTLASLRRYRWPGNVRELQNVVERVLVTADGEDMDEGGFLQAFTDSAEGRTDGERTRILGALERNRWHRQATARELSVSRVTLWRKMVKHGLAPTRPAPRC